MKIRIYARAAVMRKLPFVFQQDTVSSEPSIKPVLNLSLGLLRLSQRAFEGP
jgi:hypothetical protein